MSVFLFGIFYAADTPNMEAQKADTNNIRTEEKYVPYAEWRDAMIKRAESELKRKQSAK